MDKFVDEKVENPPFGQTGLRRTISVIGEALRDAGHRTPELPLGAAVHYAAEPGLAPPRP